MPSNNLSSLTSLMASCLKVEPLIHWFSSFYFFLTNHINIDITVPLCPYDYLKLQNRNVVLIKYRFTCWHFADHATEEGAESVIPSTSFHVCFDTIFIVIVATIWLPRCPVFKIYFSAIIPYIGLVFETKKIFNS